MRITRTLPHLPDRDPPSTESQTCVIINGASTVARTVPRSAPPPHEVISLIIVRQWSGKGNVFSHVCLSTEGRRSDVWASPFPLTAQDPIRSISVNCV